VIVLRVMLKKTTSILYFHYIYIVRVHSLVGKYFLLMLTQ